MLTDRRGRAIAGLTALATIAGAVGCAGSPDASDAASGGAASASAPASASTLAPADDLLADPLPIDPAFYAAHGVRRADEVTARRGAASYTFRRPDGRFVAHVAASPLNVRDPDGRLRPIDPRVAPGAAGFPALPARAGGAPSLAVAWANTHNVLATGFGADARAGVVAALDADRDGVAELALRWVPTRRVIDGPHGELATAAAPAPAIVAGAEVVHPGTYPDVIERWTVGRGHLKHDLELYAPPGEGAPGGWLAFEGLLLGAERARLVADGAAQAGPFTTRGSIIVDAGAPDTLRVEAPVVYERDRPTRAAPAEYRVRRDADGRVVLAVAVPLDWLRDPDRRWPVIVDPTVTVGSVTGTAPIYLSNEVEPVCATGQLIRGGASHFLRIGLIDNPGPAANGFWCYRAAFKFDTTAIPADATIGRVDLDAYVVDAYQVGDLDFVRLAPDPETMTNAALFSAIDQAAVHYRSDYVPPGIGAWFGGPPGQVGVDLGATAAADLQARLADGYFALGAHRGNHADEWEVGSNVHRVVELTRVNLANEPRLYVTFVAPPRVTAVEPPAGLNTQATPVTITGQFFDGATGVTIGGAPLGAVVVASPTTITATVPAGIAPGAYPVIVTTPAGTSAAHTRTFTAYQLGAPTVLSITPDRGRSTTATPVTIRGTNLTGTTGVTIAGAALTGITVVSDTRLTATVPFDLPPGTYPVIVTTPLGTSAGNTASFEVLPPGATVPWATSFEVGEPTGVADGSAEPGRWHVESSNACYGWTARTGSRWLHEGADTAGGTYPASIQYHFYTFGPFDLSGAWSALTFELYRWLRMEGKVAGAYWDGVNVKISTDGGETWALLTPTVGPYTEPVLWLDEVTEDEPGWGADETGWNLSRFDLLPYAGQTEVLVKLVFASDTTGGDCGAAIDDVSLSGTPVLPPAPAIGTLTDADDTLGLDGRDVTVTWTEPANLAQVSFYRIYVLPAATPLAPAVHAPIASVAKTSGGAARSFTGAAGMTTDSAGAPWVGGAAYRAYVASVDTGGRVAPSAASAPAILVDDLPCTDLDGDGYCAETDDCDDGDDQVHPGAAERCNGVDDDCDPATADGVDEPWLGAACDGPDADACLEGVYVCEAGAQACTDATGDTPEVCNGADDDCDGAIDEGACVDECALGLDDCDPNATCSDLPIGWACACDDGYTGDGRTCADVDECALGLDDCHPAAACTNLPGGFSCACNPGYVGDGRTCVREPGWECAGEPPDEVCTEICGDELVVGEETCDDGNDVPHDGCTGCRLDGDADGDGIVDELDNCPDDANPDQEDLDGDGLGDACDPDADGDGFLDGSELGGAGCGGCGGGGGGGALALLLAAGALALARRARGAAGVAAAALALAWAPAAARAQAHDGFAVERFRLAGDGDGLIGVDWAGVPHHGSWDAALWLGASNDPLVVHLPGRDDPAAALVARRVGSGASASVALWRRVQLAAAIAAVVFQDDRDPGAVQVGEPAPLPAAGLSEARLAVKLRLVGAPGGALHVALTPAVTVPLGGAEGYLRDAGPRLEPELAVGADLGAARLALNLGYRARPDVMAVSLAIGDELYVRAGVGVRLGPADAPRGEVVVALAGATAAGAPLGGGHRDALELLVGGVMPAGAVQVFAAVGAGLGAGWGTPDWRVIAGTRFRVVHHDRDGDGILDHLDRCPREPEDRDGFEDADGCPDPDDDGDGIPDHLDRCPREPEDLDGFEDADGCPDLDDDGDGIPDHLDRCPREPETVNGLDDDDGCPDELPVAVRGRVVAGGAPVADVEVTITGGDGDPWVVHTGDDGEFALTLDAPVTLHLEARKHRYVPATATVEARAQLAPTEIELELRPRPPSGEVRGLVRDFRGRPLAARVRIEPGGATAVTDADGLFRLEVPPGSYDVTIEADGHRSQTRKVRVELDGVTVLNADLKPRR